MKVNSIIRTVFLSAFMMLTLFMSAQDGFKDEAAMAKQADALFKKEQYRKAYEYYQTLLSNHRDNTLYSYRFGVCMMYSDKKDKEKPIKYIEVAANDPEMDIRVFYYLGRAYHQNYRFSEAKLAYQKYKALAKTKAVAKFDIDRRIQECNNGLSLLSNIHLLYVINKVEVKESSFYRTYNMKSSGGMIIMKPEKLITKYDKKHNNDYTAFYIPENRIIYFSSYGNKGLSGKDIYRAHQLPDGGWSEPQALSSNINTEYDDAYPFITKDGSTLYFSSKGHNSMGGYDIFKSTFDPGLFSWLKPVNMNFPINTPFDDIFYVPDTSSRFASFASTRSSVEGLIYVYKIGTDKQEEEQDFAKVLKEGGDINAAIKLIKDVADMKTNINIEDYKEKIAKITDTTSISEAVIGDTSENFAIKSDDVAAPIINISHNEAVDSTFSTYRELQYRIIGLKKQQKSIRRVYHKNKKLSEEILANQGSEGEKEAAKYQKAAKVANEIDRELSQEIANTQWAADKMIELASNMQYYQSNGNKDSVLAIYNKVVNLRKSLTYEENYSDRLLKEQNETVKQQREKASKFYELSQSYDKEIEDLKSERDEYIAEEANTIDEAEKSDYKELISEMNIEISKKETAREQAISKWKEARSLADNISEQASYTQKSLAQFDEETKDIDYNNYNYIKAEDKQTVDAEIAVVQNNKSNKLIVVKQDDKPIVVASIAEDDLDNNEFNEADTKENNDVAINENENIVPNSDSLSNQLEEKIDYLEEPKSKELLAEIDSKIDVLKKEEQSSKRKAFIAKKLAEEKYAEYQKLNESLEKYYAKFVLNNNMSSKNKIKELNKLKQGLIDANKLKKEAAAAYSIAQVYDKEAANRSHLLDSFEEKKLESTEYIKQGEFDKAEEVSVQISNYVSPNLDANLLQSNEKSISKLNQEENRLKYQQDSLDIVIANLNDEQDKLNSTSDDYKKNERNINKLNEQKDEIALQLDIVNSNMESLKQISKMQNRIVASNSKGNIKVDSTQHFEIPEEMRTKDHLIAAFSGEQLQRQIKAIDESIVDVRQKEEEEQAVAQLDTLDVLAIPTYASAKQNEAAQNIVKPRVDAIKETAKQNEKLEKLIAISLLAAKDYNNQYQAKTNELQNAYDDIDTSLSREEQADKIAKIEQIEKEQLEFNKKQEAALQYANILKKEKEENTKNIELLRQQVTTTKVLIAKNQLDSAASIDAQELMLADISGGNGDYLTNHLQVYSDENEVVSNEIEKLQQNASADNTTTRKIDSLNTIMSQNNTIISMIKEQAQYSNDEQRLAKVDSNMIARSALVPIVAINNDIFNPDYLESHSIVESLELPDAVENTTDSTLEETHEPTQMEAVVITANRISKNEILHVKQRLALNELDAVDEEISILTKIKNESLDDEEISSIDDILVSLESDKLRLNNSLKEYDSEISKNAAKGIDTDIDANQLDVDQVVADIGIMQDSLLASSKQLRKEADLLKGKAKRAKISEAEKNEKIAFELGLDAVDIVAQRNNKTYHENNVAIAKKSSNNSNGFDISEAKAYTLAARQNMVAASERRKMVATDDYSQEEADKLNKEAEGYERQSIINQNKALAVYENGGAIAQNNDTIERNVEEIPYDALDSIKNEKTEKLAENEAVENNIDNKEGVANPIIVPVLIPSEKDSLATAQSPADSVVSEDIAMQEGVENDSLIGTKEQNELKNTESENANELVVIPILSPSQRDSMDKINNQASVAENNDNEIVNNESENANDLVVIPILTPSQIDSIDQVENQAALAQNKENTAEISNEPSLSESELVKENFGIKTEAKNVVAKNENDIPDNSELLPIGLVFKVQMAAFKRKVPLSTFKGISPVAAEHIPNSSFIRYVGGIFPNYNYAKPVRDIIRAKGFKDAFIVAYFDGKRISIAQARKLIASGRAYTSNGLTQFAIRNNTNYYVLSDNKQAIASNENIVAGIPSIEASEDKDMLIAESVSSAGMGIAYDNEVKNTDSISSIKKMEGLVFKVQIEALKRDVPLDYFKGIKPIWKEKRAGSDLNYYIAGSFPNYVNAAEARDRIHAMGYPGAFIVVYFNGQRISTEDANQLIKDNKAFTTPSLAKYAMENNTEYYRLASKQKASLTIYYSVQIGVFGSPRSADRLLNLPDLYFNRTNKGYYRYLAGKYTNENTAKIARDQIRNKGIKDAYVVAFQNGKLVNINNARKLEADAKQKGIAVSRDGAVSKAKTAITSSNKNDVQVNDIKSEQGISFKVQLGAYRGTRNSAQLKVINSMSENGISSYSTASGLTIYFTNSYASYEDAKAARSRIVAVGHTDVFVVAIQNGRKISVRKALDIIEK